MFLRVGELIAERERVAGVRISDSAIARATGISRTTVGLYRADNVTRPDVATLQAFMRFFGIKRYADMFSSEVQKL